MSLLGLLPIIQLVCGASSWRCDDFAVSGWIFFGNNFDRGKVAGEAGAGEFVGLLGMVALGHQDEAVAAGQLVQCLFHAGQQFDLLFGDGAGKALNALALFHGDRGGAEPLKAITRERVKLFRP